MTSRRNMILGLASGVAALGAIGWTQRNTLMRYLVTRSDNSDLPITTAPTLDADLCVLTTEQVQGPFFFSAPERADITEDREGIPLDLTLQVTDASGCAPIAGVPVEIWHCDARGRYSGYPEDLSRDLLGTLQFIGDAGNFIDPVNERTYLRGVQTSDASGIVRFRTIFPGWYDLRTPHIHFKVRGSAGELITSQFYFDDALASRIYRDHPLYAPWGESPFTNHNDGVIAGVGAAEGLVLRVTETAQGMTSEARIGVSAT